MVFALVACRGEVALGDANDTNQRLAEGSGDTPDGSQAATAPQCESVQHTQELNGDGGVGSTVRAQCASLVIDGTSCNLDPKDVGLDFGLDGHGWAASADASACLGGLMLTIQGVDDAPYPQTAVVPFLSEQAAWLAVSADETDDAGVGDGVYSSSPLGSSTIEQGPVKENGTRTLSVIKGSARVVSSTGRARNVQYYFAF